MLVSVTDAAAPRASDAPPVPLVIARFGYDAAARLRRFDAHGPWVEDARHAQLREQVLSNPRGGGGG